MVMETHEARIKRMTMRSWRRGIKEMDLILGPYADAYIAQMDEAALTLYDALLEENDQDLLAMILGQQEMLPQFAKLLAEIEEFSRGRLAKAQI
jgi:antitoxin CptB